MDIQFDPVKAQINSKKHGVGFNEAASVLLDPMALAFEDPNSEGEARWIVVGMGHAGRLLTVVYTLRDRNSIRLISARKATRKEANHYA